jgi:MFS superfamily sulfate permease-like transporter
VRPPNKFNKPAIVGDQAGASEVRTSEHSGLAYPIVRFRKGQFRNVEDTLAVEEPLEIRLCYGPFLFGTTQKLEEATRDLAALPAIVILRLRNMTAIDATGIHALEVFASRLRKSGRTLLPCGARDQPLDLLTRADFVDEVERENILPNMQTALDRVHEIGAAFNGVGPEIAHDMLNMTIWPEMGLVFAASLTVFAYPPRMKMNTAH